MLGPRDRLGKASLHPDRRGRRARGQRAVLFAGQPPQPGAARPQDTAASTQAMQALFGGPAPRSATERLTLEQAGNADADTGIRSGVADPGTNVVDKGATTRDIIAAPAGDGQTAKTTTP